MSPTIPFVTAAAASTPPADMRSVRSTADEATSGFAQLLAGAHSSTAKAPDGRAGHDDSDGDSDTDSDRPEHKTAGTTDEDSASSSPTDVARGAVDVLPTETLEARRALDHRRTVSDTQSTVATRRSVAGRSADTPRPDAKPVETRSETGDRNPPASDTAAGSIVSRRLVLPAGGIRHAPQAMPAGSLRMRIDTDLSGHHGIADSRHTGPAASKTADSIVFVDRVAGDDAPWVRLVRHQRLLAQGAGHDESGTPGELPAPASGSAPGIGAVAGGIGTVGPTSAGAQVQPAWAEALIQQTIQIVRHGARQATLELHPRQLGVITIAVDISDGRQAALHFTAAHTPVRDAIEAALPQLRHALAAGGLALGQTSIGDPGSTPSFAGNSDSSSASSRGRQPPSPETVSGVSPTTQSVHGTNAARPGAGLIDLFA